MGFRARFERACSRGEGSYPVRMGELDDDARRTAIGDLIARALVARSARQLDDARCLVVEAIRLAAPAGLTSVQETVELAKEVGLDVPSEDDDPTSGQP